MTYRIEGLSPGPFQPLFALDDEELARLNARRLVADGQRYPCRISLSEAEPGESLLLVNHLSQPACSPFRASNAIYVRFGATASVHVGQVPPLLDTRILSLRGFDSAGMLKGARLANPGEADRGICEMFEQPEVEEIHAHNAAFGCFLARIGRHLS